MEKDLKGDIQVLKSEAKSGAHFLLIFTRKGPFFPQCCQGFGESSTDNVKLSLSYMLHPGTACLVCLAPWIVLFFIQFVFL